MARLAKAGRRLIKVGRRLAVWPCCCGKRPCFHRYDACPDNPCDTAEGTIYVVCEAGCDVVAWKGGCYERVDDTQYTDCQGGPPPDGFACLPDGAVTVTEGFECVPDCQDDLCFNVWFLPQLCPGQDVQPNYVPVVRCEDLPDECQVFSIGSDCWTIGPDSPSRPDLPPNHLIVDPPFNEFGSCCACTVGDCDEQELDTCWEPGQSCPNDVPPQPCCCRFENVHHSSTVVWHRDIRDSDDNLIISIDITGEAKGSPSSPGPFSATRREENHITGDVFVDTEEGDDWGPTNCYPFPYTPFESDCDIPANQEPEGCASCSVDCDILSITGVCRHQAGALNWTTTMTLTARAFKQPGDCGTNCAESPGIDPQGPTLGQLLGIG